MPRKQSKKGANERFERSEHDEQASIDRSRPIGKKEQNRIPPGSDPALSRSERENERADERGEQGRSSVREDVHVDEQDRSSVQPDVHSEEAETSSESPSGILTSGMVAAIRKARKEKGWSIRRISHEWGVAVGTAHKAVADVVPQVVPEPEEDTPSQSATSPAVPEPRMDIQPDKPTSDTQLLSEDILMKIVLSLIQEKVRAEEIGPFLDRARANLQNSTPTQSPRMPRVSSEVTGQRPVVLDSNNGSGSNPSTQVSSLPMPRLDQEEIAKILMLFGNDVVKNGHTNFPDFFQATLIPKIRATEYFEAWLPGADILEKQKNFERYMKAARRYLELGEAYVAFQQDSMRNGGDQDVNV